MHTCWKVPELLAIIFEWAFCTEAFEHGPKTLARLARTCRLFKDAALDILWHTQTTMSPLIKLFPENLWVIEVELNGNRAMRSVKLIQPPQAADWTRVLDYAARIKTFAYYHPAFYSHDYLRQVHPSSYGLLLQHRPSGHFFPSLRRFEWRQASDDIGNSVAHLLLMMDPRVSDMSVYMSERLIGHSHLIAQVEHALKDFGERCQFLEHIALLSPSIPTFTALVSDILLRHNHLQTVYVFQHSHTPISHEALLHLARLSTLRKFAVRIDNFPGSIDALCSVLGTADIIFPALQYLVVYSTTLGAFGSLMDVMQTRCLERLDVLVFPAPTALEVKVFTTRLAQPQYRASMTAFTITAGTGSPRGQEDYIITSNVLKPLLSLPNMHECKLEMRCPLQLDNAFLNDLALAWPKLHILELESEWRRDTGTPKVTLRGLIPLVRHCPELIRLGLAFDTNVSELKEIYEEKRPGEGVSNFQISVLSVGTSRVQHLDEDDTFILAGFLSDLFPNLQSIDSLWGRRQGTLDGDEDGRDFIEAKQWGVVQELTREMGRIRRQERRWRIKVTQIQAAMQTEDMATEEL